MSYSLYRQWGSCHHGNKAEEAAGWIICITHYKRYTLWLSCPLWHQINKPKIRNVQNSFNSILNLTDSSTNQNLSIWRDCLSNQYTHIYYLVPVIFFIVTIQKKKEKKNIFFKVTIGTIWYFVWDQMGASVILHHNGISVIIINLLITIWRF